VEHNIISGSSWPVRGVGCEFRYNLVLDAGHQWLWADSSGGSIHHNVFAGGDEDVGGVYALYNPQNVRHLQQHVRRSVAPEHLGDPQDDRRRGLLRSNLFLNDPNPSRSRSAAGRSARTTTSSTTPSAPNYSDGRRAHPRQCRGAQINPMLTAPPSVPFDLSESVSGSGR
jgi:hypothetical protein